MGSNNENNSYNMIIVACICGASLVILAFLGMLVHNNQKKAEAHKKSIESVIDSDEINENASDESSEVKDLIGDNQFVSSDLDFWDMYDEIDDSSYISGDGTQKTKPKKKVDDLGDAIDDTDNSEAETDEDVREEIDYEDEYHIAITDDEGEKVYYEIMADVPKNNFKYSDEFEYKDNIIKYNGEDYLCYSGIDISKYQGTIDFVKVKNAGVDFAMIRVAYRGSTTGQIALDDNFVINANSAKAVGIPIGAYFYTQALTENEAIEEANFAAAAIGNFGVTYPVAIDVEFSKSPGDRASKLSVEDRTKCVKAFMDTIKNLGYKPMLYASKEMLIAGLDVSELIDYDVWLSEPVKNNQIFAGYPYMFSMWQYDIDGRVDGINNAVDLDIYLIKKEDN